MRYRSRRWLQAKRDHNSRMKGNIVFRTWARRFGVAALAVSAVAATGLSTVSAGAAAKPAAAVKKAGAVFGSGSDAAYKSTSALDTLYNQSSGCRTIIQPPETVQPSDFSCLPDDVNTIKTENYTHDVVSEAYPLGASVGISQVCANLSKVNFARNVRTPSATDCTGLHFVSFARDGLAWECFGGCHGVTNLTKTQLQGIYGNCSINDWSQVGGSAGPIVVYGVNPGAGVKSNWNKYLGLSATGDTFCAPNAAHVIHQNENQEIFANGDQASAIFYFAISNWNTVIAPNPDGSALGSLEGVTPSEAHITDGTYALGFNEGFVYCAASTGAAPCPQKASKQTLNYVGETKGWVCKASATGDHRGAHSVDPLTGDNYRLEIENTLGSFGLVPIAYGPTGGSAVGSSFCRETDH
jgi:ABC-type phosphate transport system substrate-binding protein